MIARERDSYYEELLTQVRQSRARLSPELVGSMSIAKIGMPRHTNCTLRHSKMWRFCVALESKVMPWTQS
eukprot:3785970-Amphidinium_carterae.1